MIVDDEYLFREALKISIPWNELGYEICCDAENGYDALEKIRQYEPEVVLVDINMPVMDGLELAAEIKEMGLDVRVVIITGYSEFNYAQQAIQLGVENYLLKPVDEQDLARILTMIKNDIEKEANARLETDALKKQVQQYRPILKEMILNDLLLGNNQRRKEDFLELTDYFSANIEASSFQAVIIEMDENRESGWTADDRQLWSSAVSNVAGEIISSAHSFDLCRDIENRINIIVYHGNRENEPQKDIINLCERIRISISKYLKFTVTIGVGRIYDDICKLPLSYKEAVFSLKNKLVTGGNRIYYFDNFPGYDMKMSLYTVDQRKQLLMSLRVGDINGALEILRSIFNQAQQSNYPSDLIMAVSVELISTCLEFIAETGFTVKAVMGRDLNIFQDIQERKSLSELETYISEVFSKAYRMVHGTRNRRSAGIVEEVKDYIHENFTRNDLKIDEIARQIHIKYGHLCFIFKRETGSTINDYITEIRIKRAKELIDEGMGSVSKVSGMVGYADANYFGKCFKKLYGLTPSKYMENKIK